MWEKLGDAQTAAVWLERAVVFGESEGYIRTFVDEGVEVARILERLRKTEYIHTLLEAFSGIKRSTAKIQPSEGLVEPLSQRELEVLRLLAQGMKYAEIAEQLVISTNTVRFHIKSIYSKFGVDKQVKAIERGRELGLLE